MRSVSCLLTQVTLAHVVALPVDAGRQAEISLGAGLTPNDVYHATIMVQAYVFNRGVLASTGRPS